MERKYIRDSYSGITFGLSTLRTIICTHIILGFTDVTYVMHPTSW
jgi:hypothetical protein